MFRVIIVDDEKKIREGMKKLINWEEYDFSIIGQASDGVEALELCRNVLPDLVITDIKMPRMDGLTLASELKKINSHINIIILSGYSDFSYAKQAIKYGVDNYLLKPVNIGELCTELDKIRQDIISKQSHEENIKQDIKNLENLFLIRLINGDLDREEALIEPSNQKLCLENAKSLCICVLDIAGDFTKSSLKLEPARQSLREFLDQYLAATKSKYLCEYSKGRYCILVKSIDVPLKIEQLVEDSQEIIKVIKEHCGIDSIISIGDVVTAVIDLKTSYNRAISLIEMRKSISGSEKVLYKLPIGSSADIIEILMYVNRHYAEELSLKKLAEVFYINPGYLGQLLKKETGEYFNELLNKIRIENSKKYLKANLYSIQKVSEMVGYKNIDHFYKNFKVIVGKNPADYKKQFI
jgi:Response regulator containing CheY-like receiver domain and AraC-type DNA-binding domain